jgi:all-trans-retinol dehydrogenase (NAD+)
MSQRRYEQEQPLLWRVLKLPVQIVRKLALEPITTGFLIYALTRDSPSALKDRLLASIQQAGISPSRILQVLPILRSLFALGVARRIHHVLSALATNYWHIRWQGKPWNFGDRERSEVIVLSGGCSGFGALMTKGFAGKAKIVILDILDLPEDLAKRMNAPPGKLGRRLNDDSGRCVLLQMRPS